VRGSGAAITSWGCSNRERGRTVATVRALSPCRTPQSRSDRIHSPVRGDSPAPV